MKYKDFDLKKIRTEMDLDFAHFTYSKGMCSCCYGPKDLPKRYWKNGIVLNDVDYDSIEYLLFKNADNGSGTVKRDDELKKRQNIEWNFPMEKLDGVCKMLQEQVGDEYEVVKPEDEYTCIIIIKKEN